MGVIGFSGAVTITAVLAAEFQVRHCDTVEVHLALTMLARRVIVLPTLIVAELLSIICTVEYDAQLQVESDAPEKVNMVVQGKANTVTPALSVSPLKVAVM